MRTQSRSEMRGVLRVAAPAGGVVETTGVSCGERAGAAGGAGAAGPGYCSTSLGPATPKKSCPQKPGPCSLASTPAPCSSLHFPAPPCSSLHFPAPPCSSLHFPAPPCSSQCRHARRRSRSGARPGPGQLNPCSPEGPWADLPQSPQLPAVTQATRTASLLCSSRTRTRRTWGFRWTA